MMEAQRLRLGVGVHIGTLALRGGFFRDNRDAALGADDVFDEKRDFAHHRTPTGLIPTDRAILESDL